MSKPFKFKQFDVVQDRSAMKLGTDGVLLGAWATCDNPHHILDIGTGTGVIALQMAQRFRKATIDALDIDKDASEEAKLNFENSKWTHRLTSHHVELKRFITDTKVRYDLILSNPPYFDNSYKPSNEKRAIARHLDSLPYNTLLNSCHTLLAEDGKAAFIIPFTTENKFLKIAEQNHLFPSRLTHVKGNNNAKIKRSLIMLSQKRYTHVVSDILILEIKRHVYTKEYLALVKDFYWKL